MLVISDAARTDIAGLDLIAPLRALEDAIGIPVEVIASNDVIPCTQQAHDSAFRTHGRSKSKRVYPVFQGGKTLLQHVSRTVVHSRVHKAFPLKQPRSSNDDR